MQLQERITRKLDEFFSLAAYDWLGPADGRAVNESPSPYMTDMTEFLAAQFKSYAGFLNVRTRHTCTVLYHVVRIYCILYLYCARMLD